MHDTPRYIAIFSDEQGLAEFSRHVINTQFEPTDNELHGII
jgi:hypothetical protein